MTTRLDTKTFHHIGHGLPLLQDEQTGRELVKSKRKREDDVFKVGFSDFEISRFLERTPMEHLYVFCS